MNRKLIMAGLLVVALSGRLWAEEASLEVRAEKLGALRSRVSTKLNELAKLTDNGQNGVGAAYQAMEYNWQQIRGELNKRSNAEIVKQGEQRDQALIDTLAAKGQKLDKLWADHVQDWQTYVRTSGELLGTYQNLTQVHQYISSTDQPWLRAGLEPDVLTAALAAMDKRVDEIKSGTTKIATDFKKNCDQRLQQIKE